MPYGHRVLLLQLFLVNICILNSINVVNVSVPEMIPSGSRAVLNCSYTVSPGQFMDSVKWYLNTSEIYRIVPSLTKDRVLTFPLACLHVSLPQSGLLRAGSHRLVLEKVTEECQGTYTCQVTSGSPPFHTGAAGDHLGVSVLPPPGSHPVLAGVQHHYQLGQHLSATCTSPHSNPPARIQWTFNGEQVAANNSFINWTTHGLATSISYLVIKLSSPRLPTTLTIICTSILGKKYREESVRLARLDKPSSPVLGEPLMSSKSIISKPSSSPISFLVFWLGTFVITKDYL